MAIPVFGVTAAKVRDHHFPQRSYFSTTSNPTAAIVLEMIQAGGAKLAGKLRAKGVTPSTINDDAGSTYSEAYAWCAETVRLEAAVRILPAATGATPEVGKKWESELKARYDDLDDRGHLALGDAPAPAQEANGPRWHGATYGLEVGDDADVSTLVPRFRRDDEL